MLMWQGQTGLKLNVNFLSEEGVATDPEVKAVKEWPFLDEMKQLQPLLGMVGNTSKIWQNLLQWLNLYSLVKKKA